MYYKNFGTGVNSFSIFRPSYDIFAKTGRVGLSLEFLDSLVVDSISASNLVWLEEVLGSAFFMKVVLLCLTFPMV